MNWLDKLLGKKAPASQPARTPSPSAPTQPAKLAAVKSAAPAAEGAAPAAGGVTPPAAASAPAASRPAPAAPPDFTAQVRELEAMRLQISAAQSESGSLSDYVDLGRPSAEARAKAEARMDDLGRQITTLTARMEQQVNQYRQQQPAVIQQWVELHLGLCRELAAAPVAPNAKPGDKDLMSVFIAKQTIAEWEKVLAGQQAYFPINTVWMKDYEGQIRSRLNATRP